MQQLPIHCEAYYWRDFLQPSEATALFDEIIGGYEVTDRMCKMADGTLYEQELGVYMFADASLTSLEALPEAWGQRAPWPDSLAKVRERIRDATGVGFQVARCVYYANGSDGMAFHADPPAYGPTDAIASLSLGAEREFVFRALHDPEERYSLTLQSGSLLFMGNGCQERYEHSIPHCERCKEPRLNLTFRKYGWDRPNS